jgi:hypothetical protein
MRINVPLDQKTALMIAAVSAAIILFPIGYSVVYAVFAQGAQSADTFLEKADGEYCLKDVDPADMRFHHMDLLKKARDLVVREGVRGDVECEWDGKRREIRLDNCWDCHTSRKRFCNQCHNAVSLQLDCFRCHYDPSL